MKEKEGHIYKQIQEALNKLPDNVSILEEQIDIEQQLEYFNFAQDLKKEFDPEIALSQKENLFNKEYPLKEKKKLLVLLASVNEVEAYRTIEKYTQIANQELKEWSILALQESRMLMHSTLLDEEQVFISTGLGGQGQKLRYFAVIRGKNFSENFSATQQKLIKSELKFAIKNNDGIFEEIDFDDGFAKFMFLMPLKANIQEVFRSVIAECNQYGDFLDEDIIITNVRKLNTKEIKDFLANLPDDENNKDINYEDEE